MLISYSWPSLRVSCGVYRCHCHHGSTRKKHMEDSGLSGRRTATSISFSRTAIERGIQRHGKGFVLSPSRMHYGTSPDSKACLTLVQTSMASRTFSSQRLFGLSARTLTEHLCSASSCSHHFLPWHFPTPLERLASTLPSELASIL